MKTKALFAVTLLVGSMSCAFADNLQVVNLVAGADGMYSANIGDTVVGDATTGTTFTDTYTFNPSSFTSATVASILSTVSLNDSSGITFSNVSLNNVSYAITDSALYTLPSLAIGAGAVTSGLENLTLTVSGLARGTASYGGSFAVGGTVSAVPEPGTYAMLIAGLGLIGFMRRRRSSSTFGA